MTQMSKKNPYKSLRTSRCVLCGVTNRKNGFNRKQRLEIKNESVTNCHALKMLAANGNTKNKSIAGKKHKQTNA